MTDRGSSAARRSGDRALARVIELNGRLLATSVVAGGLGELRPRSAPDRVTREVTSFLDLLRVAASGARTRTLDRAIDRELAQGALAAARPSDLTAVLLLWRRALDALLAEPEQAATREHASQLLDELERRIVRRARRMAGSRLDLVVVAASAGGIQALRYLFETIAPDLAATFIVVQHVSPHGPSLIPTIMARSTRMPLAHAVEGAALYLAHVYFAPPGRHLVIAGERLHLIDGPPIHHTQPAADILFQSAAGAFGTHVLSSVLSGTGVDGASGTRVIHDHGGLTFVQDPETAEFRGMPEAAIDTGAVDLVASLPVLARTMERVIRNGRSALTR